MNRALVARIRSAAGNRCGYCRAPQAYVLGPLEIDHIIPVAMGGTDDEANLWLACRLCNNAKGARLEGVDPRSGRSVPLFNPRKDRWAQHFKWQGVLLVGRTLRGRATVAALALNNDYALDVRSAWSSVGWHPPQEEAEE